jgi:putative flippase GtrA
MTKPTSADAVAFLEQKSGQARDLIHQLAHSFLRFGLVGACVTAFNYGFFLAILQCGYQYMTALLVSWVFSVVLGFVLNRRITFRAAGRVSPKELSAYLMAVAFQLALALVGFTILVEVCSLSPAIAYPVNVVIVSLSNFLILRFLVYPLRGNFR